MKKTPEHQTGFALCIAICLSVTSSFVFASCIRQAEPQLALTQIQTCESVPGQRDLKVSGIKLEYYDLNQTLIAKGGTGEAEDWVFLNHSNPKSCDDLLGSPLQTISYPTCCDVIPSALLDCQLDQDAMQYFNPKSGQEVDLRFLNTINRISYVIGQDEPFTGTAINYSRSHRDAMKITWTEIEFIEGRRSGILRRVNAAGNIIETRDEKEFKEIVRSFNDEGTMTQERVEFRGSWKDNWKTDKRGYTQTWDEEGNVTCTYEHTNEPCLYTQDDQVIP